MKKREFPAASAFEKLKNFASVLGAHLIPYHEHSGIWDVNIIKGYRGFLTQRGTQLKSESEELLG